MSLSISELNETEASEFSSAMIEETSVLNDNVKFSQLEISEVPEDESTMNVKLSITLDQDERELLAKQKKGKQSDRNCNLSTLSTYEEDTVNASKSTDIEDKTQTSVTIQEETLEEDEDESIIPIDDETDSSTLQTTKINNDEMFSHLQLAASTQESCDEQSSQLLISAETDYFQHPFIELGRRLWLSTEQQQCYTKGCLWSPDGTCLLVPVHYDGMHILELPTDLYTTTELDGKRELSPLNSAVHVKEGGMVYDCMWYPFMNSTDPATCCWLASRQHEPIHMWDAFTGELRCSYRGYDDVDEVESAISIAFSNDGEKVVGGYKKNIKIFDTNIPGRDYTSIPVKQAISCFAFTTENDNCVTTGSWNGFIYHYDLRAPKLGPLFVLSEHTGGVTWLKYSAYNTDNWYLFSGARKDDRILQWDMRNYQKPVKTYERKVETNQRIYFDMSPQQKWLISGDTQGFLRIWDVDEEKLENIQIPLHSDCCNGVSFHPTLPIISTSSGQYHFTDVDVESKKSGESVSKKIISYENSVLFLWFGPSKI